MNLRQVRKKVKTVNNVKKITKAMQLVSAVKMKKAQQEALEGRYYSDTLEEIIKRVVARVDPNLSELLSVGGIDRELVILISTNKGLCGSFNSNLFRFCIKNINFPKSDFITIGKKGVVLVNRFGGKIIADFSSNKPLTVVSAVFSMALDKFLAKDYTRVLLFYNKFISALRFDPVKEAILPVKLGIDKAQEEEEKSEQRLEEYLIEPSPAQILDTLLRSFVEERIRRAIVSSEAGEHSARMIAMKSATDNADDLIYELILLRNKLRQEKITYELLDMVTAKISIESK